LKRQGYRVMGAPNGIEALQLCRQEKEDIHLLLTDVVMPKMGGKELSEQVRLLRPEIKVLFTSGFTDDAIVRQGILEPGITFLQKPFSPVSLARKVREVLDR
jgi:two-component system cell cycle sensor histidine kinase/response regulator CckA